MPWPLSGVGEEEGFAVGFWKTLCATLAVGVLLGAGPAEARFGKRSKPSASKPSDSKKDKDSRSDDDRSTHRASPVGRASDAPVRANVRPSRTRLSWVSFLFMSRPSAYHASRRADARPGVRAAAMPPMVRLNVQGDMFGETGGALGLFMGLDGQRLGMNARVTGIALSADDGSQDVDRLTLLDAHLTASLWSSERGRFRIEGGIASAHAPDVIFVGPSVAASLEACIGPSPLDVEARIQVVPFPHRQVDAQAGLALHLGALNLRGGWRTLYINDAGRLDGVVHEDAFSGPYLGLGIAF
ncbi:hypothetical protein [Corallococcus soli]|uniref:hypothetical protein n=1 Tax=Corallococcus soli TaxID=2710757 RepID=UPI001D0421FE|nr:hypothetical protein [Corallococcus soli]